MGSTPIRISLCAVLCAACAGVTPARASLSEASPRTEQLSGAQLLEVGDALARSGEHVRAEQYLMLAEQRGIAARTVMPRLLSLYAADGQYRLAIDRAETYLQQHPNEVRVRQCLASFYAAVGALDGAVRAYDRVLADLPDNAEAHFALASLLHDAGLERARMDAHYRAYVTLAPHGPHAEEARAGLLKALP
jgi:tetratricopeptide (TPR) repeat protein